MAELSNVHSSAACNESTRMKRESRQSCQTRQQLTSLLSSVQDSLAELKVEVASARQLSYGAVAAPDLQPARSISPASHEPAKGSRSELMQSLTAHRSAGVDEKFWTGSHAASPTIPAHTAHYDVATSYQAETIACNSLELRLLESPRCRSAEQPVCASDNGNIFVPSSAPVQNRCDLEIIALMQRVQALETKQVQAEELQHVPQEVSSHVVLLQDTVKQLTEGTHEVRQEIRKIQCQLRDIENVRHDHANSMNMVNKIEHRNDLRSRVLHDQHGAHVPTCQQPLNSEMDVNETLDPAKSLQQNLLSVVNLDTLGNAVQVMAAQIQSIDAELKASASCTVKVNALDKKLHELMGVISRESSLRAPQALFEKVHDIERKMDSLQQSHEDNAHSQQHLVAMDIEVVKREFNEKIAQVISVTDQLSQRVNVSHEALLEGQAAIKSLQQSYLAIDELQHLIDTTRSSISHADMAHQQGSAELAMLRQDLTGLRGDCSHASAESNKQFHTIAEEIQSLQSTVEIQKASVEQALLQFTHTEDHWHSTMEPLHDAMVKKLQEIQTVQPDAKMKSHSMEGEILQGERQQNLHKMDQLGASHARQCPVIPDSGSWPADTCKAAEGLQEQVNQLAEQVSDVRQHLKKLDVELKGSTSIGKEMVDSGTREVANAILSAHLNDGSQSYQTKSTGSCKESLDMEPGCNSGAQVGWIVSIEGSIVQLTQAVSHCEDSIQILKRSMLELMIEASNPLKRADMAQLQDFRQQRNAAADASENLALSRRLSDDQIQAPIIKNAAFEEHLTSLTQKIAEVQAQSTTASEHLEKRLADHLHESRESQRKIHELEVCVSWIKLEQPELMKRVCSLSDDIVNLSEKASSEAAHGKEVDQDMQNLHHNIAQQKDHIISVQDTLELLQDSLGEHRQIVSTEKSEVLKLLQRQSEQILAMDETLMGLRSQTDRLEEKITVGAAISTQQELPPRFHESIRSIQNAACQTSTEQQSLVAEVQRLATAMCKIGSAECLEDDTCKMAAFEQRLDAIKDDVDSQQQRTENAQRTQYSLVNDLAAAVKRLEDKTCDLTGRLELQNSQMKAGVATGDDDHAAQLRKTLALVTGNDEKLSALNEVFLNTKAETAELREIVRSAQSAQQQLSDDLLGTRLGIDDRLEFLEEFVSNCNNSSIDSKINSVCATLEETQNQVVQLQHYQNKRTEYDAPTWCMELSDRVSKVEQAVTGIEESKVELDDFEAAGHHVMPEESIDKITLQTIHSTLQQLQHDVKQMQASASVQGKNAEVVQSVTELQEQVESMGKRVIDLIDLKENVVNKEQLDSVLFAMETAMDDIANDLDEIKSRTIVPQDPPVSHPAPTASKPAQSNHPSVAVPSDEALLKAMVVDSRCEDLQLQLETMGQRLRVLADDVETLERQDGRKEDLLAQTAALATRLEQVQEQVTTLKSHNNAGCIQELADRVRLLEKHASGHSTSHPYSAAKDALVDGQTVLMMHYMRPNAQTIASIETIHDNSPVPSPVQSVDGRWHPAFKSTDCNSSLSSIGGDLRVQPDGTHNSTHKDTTLHCDSDKLYLNSHRQKQESGEVTWQGNPEYSGQGEGVGMISQRYLTGQLIILQKS